MKVLVTGGAGFIGSNVTNLLIDQGHEVTVYDNLSTGYREYIDKRANFIEGDLNDSEKINSAMQGQEGVIHFAAESIIKFSIDNPKKTLGFNFNNTLNLLEAMRLNDVKKIVFSSSAAVYGETNEPVKESDPKEPLQPYGASKLAVEAMLSGYFHSFGINSTAMRYFNVYGPRDDQLPVTRAVPNWFKAILKEGKIGLYWKGSQLRDYIFVEDLAEAHLLALEKCLGLNAYNVGSGSGNTMSEILEAVFKAAGKTLEVQDLGERPGDPHKLVADISKIKSELGWAPQNTLDEGMKKTFNFYLSHPESLERI